ncbi:hypothetical protein CBG25_06195 [Arsenophonus sp. ENCA]|nr:hypothetical protein CBG25_06195 [Arsenophonus sp. ENCA]
MLFLYAIFFSTALSKATDADLEVNASTLLLTNLVAEKVLLNAPNVAVVTAPPEHNKRVA